MPGWILYTVICDRWGTIQAKSFQVPYFPLCLCLIQIKAALSILKQESTLFSQWATFTPFDPNCVKGRGHH